MVIERSTAHVAVAFEGKGLAKIAASVAAKLERVDPAEVPVGSPLHDKARWEEISLPPEQRPLPGVALPERLMSNLLWSFVGPTYDTLDDFVTAVWSYHEAIRGEQTPEQRWRPSHRALPVARVRVGYLCWRGSRQVEPVVTIVGQGPGLTEGELLWQVHNTVVADLSRDDHHFFEGFSLGNVGSAATGPLYHLSLGS